MGVPEKSTEQVSGSRVSVALAVIVRVCVCVRVAVSVFVVGATVVVAGLVLHLWVRR